MATASHPTRPFAATTRSGGRRARSFSSNSPVRCDDTLWWSSGTFVLTKLARLLRRHAPVVVGHVRSHSNMNFAVSSDDVRRYARIHGCESTPSVWLAYGCES